MVNPRLRPGKFWAGLLDELRLKLGSQLTDELRDGVLAQGWGPERVEVLTHFWQSLRADLQERGER